MKIENKNTVELIKKRIHEIDKDVEIIIYGSRARGEDNADSDWDIIILTNYPISFIIESNFREHIYELELELEEIFSVFVYFKKDWNTKHRITPFYHNVVREGVFILT